MAIAVSYPYLAGRISALSTLTSSALNKIGEERSFSKYEVLFYDQIRNCEDAILVDGHGAAILSCDAGRDRWNTVMGTFYQNRTTITPGRLWLYRYDEQMHFGSSGLYPIKFEALPDESKFHPLGIEYHENSSTLFVINHHLDGSRIEVFDLNLKSHDPIARHKRTLIHPQLTTPNSLRALNEHELFVSNDHYFQVRMNPLLAKTETYGALPLGGVVHVHMHNDGSTSVRPLARVPFANGVEFLNASTLAVASTSARDVRLYNIKSDRSLELVETISVSMMPDNLSVDKKGRLLITGHPHLPALARMISDRTRCLDQNSADESACYDMSVPSCVMEWTGESGIKTVYRTAGEFSSSSTAVRDVGYGIGLITGLYEKGILVWKE
ncbi:hypothetical protein N7539_004291 [Penicillium diatomitis]|uniref:Uncharacterized protein n=1 Tax=Penicillium diatomitis TaxID=2819901 RepID=A0A9X0BY18_9EURO|nr:uncharacterized protein N7539_004291 [Penicillium diatomitis]KAJ5489401.1 hypothetical protein N7539_004291 [Penicillium diatomitis]